MTKKKKTNTSQVILAGIAPVGGRSQLCDWKTGKIHATGTLRAAFAEAERLWPGHVRRLNGGPGRYLVLEREW